MTTLTLRGLGWGLLCLCTSWAMAQPVNDLQAALAATLKNHPSVAGKQAEVRAKVLAGETAKTQRYPSLSALVQQYSGSDASVGTSTPVTLRARQPLWSFGRIESNMAFADADAQAEKIDFLKVQRQLLENTAVAYAKVLGAQERVQVGADSLAANQAFYQQISRREVGQLASVADVRLAAARVAQASAQKERYDGELNLALDELQALTQVPVGTAQAVDERWLALSPQAVLDEQAQLQSADIQFKQLLLERARTSVEQARTAALPTVYFQVDRSANAPANQSSLHFSVVLDASLDNMGFAASGKVAEALARQTAAEEDVRTTRNEITRSIKSLVHNRQMQQGLLDAQTSSIQALEDLLASYKRQYAAGTKAWLDVLNTHRELVDQRLQVVQAMNDRLTYALRLSAMTAGLDAMAGIVQGK